MAERRGRVTEAQSTRFLELLSQLRIRVDMSQTDMKSVRAIGRRHLLSACDAAYLLLAERIAAPLATCDGKLKAAARTAGVDLAIGA